MSISRVSAAEVDELRALFQAQPIDHADNPFSILETPAEVLGYYIHQLRQLGADQDEILHDVELVLRATENDRESLRETRNTLSKLGYGPDLAKLLTWLSRKAKPRRRWGKHPPPRQLVGNAVGNSTPSKSKPRYPSIA